LSIKDDINNIEEKLSSEDKIFEGSVKLERLFKRYKKLIAIIAIALIGLLVTSQVMNYVENNRINNLNNLYSEGDRLEVRVLKVLRNKIELALSSY